MTVGRLSEVEVNRAYLAEGLRFAVPLHIAEIASWELERRLRVGLPPGWQGNIHRADAMLYRPKSPTGWNNMRLAFGTWARGLAVLAFEPGGVSVFGLHFCASPHEGCPKDWAPREPVQLPEVNPLDEYAALLGVDLDKIAPMWEDAA